MSEQEVVFTVWQLILAFLLAMGIPGAITGIIVWNFERKITKRDKAKEAAEAEAKEKAKAEEKAKIDAMAAREDAREKLDLIMVEGINAAIALGEATARAVQRIPDAHCNGDMHEALDYAKEVKHRQKDFLSAQGIKAIQN